MTWCKSNFIFHGAFSLYSAEGINKGKTKWQERQEAQRMEEEKEERAEYERLKAKYGKDDHLLSE